MSKPQRNPPGRSKSVNSEPLREITQAACACAFGHALRERGELIKREMADEPITGDAAFGKEHQPHALLRRIRREALDRREVRGLVAGRTFHLDGGNADRRSHAPLSMSGTPGAIAKWTLGCPKVACATPQK